MSYKKPKQSGIYFNKEYGYYVYDAPKDVLFSIMHEPGEPVGVTIDKYWQDIKLEYVCHDIIALIKILKSYETKRVPDHVKWSQTRLAS